MKAAREHDSGNRPQRAFEVLKTLEEGTFKSYSDLTPTTLRAAV